MSIVATKWARRINVPPTQKLVLLTLADFADEDGVCWPSGRRLSEETGLSDRCIRYSMSEFRKHGLIMGGGRPGSYQKITLNFDTVALSEEQLSSLKKVASQRNRAAAAASKPAAAAQSKPAAASADPAAASADTAAAADHIKTTNNHQEPIKAIEAEKRSDQKAPKTDLDAEFEAFWSAYPRKSAKGSAKKAFAKARKVISAEKLLAAVNAWPFPEPSERGDFRPYAASWLNAERWEDESVQHAMQAQADREQFPIAQIAAHEEACRKWRASGFDGPKPKIEQFALEIA